MVATNKLFPPDEAENKRLREAAEEGVFFEGIVAFYGFKNVEIKPTCNVCLDVNASTGGM
jgi:hypothetical protein